MIFVNCQTFLATKLTFSVQLNNCAAENYALCISGLPTALAAVYLSRLLRNTIALSSHLHSSTLRLNIEREEGKIVRPYSAHDTFVLGTIFSM